MKTLFACEAKQPGFTGTKTGNFPGVQPEKFPGLRRHICFLVFGRLGQQCGVRESLDDIQTLLVFVVQYAHLEK